MCDVTFSRAVRAYFLSCFPVGLTVLTTTSVLRAAVGRYKDAEQYLLQVQDEVRFSERRGFTVRASDQPKDVSCSRTAC